MKKTFYAMIGLALLFACAKPQTGSPRADDEILLRPIFPGTETRATAAGFESGDRIGVYITRYNGDKPADLQLGGNWGSNLLLSFNGSSWWLSPKVYWDEGLFDIYAYYPRMEVSSVDALPFRVAEDQTVSGGVEGMDAFEASDFLWAKAAGVSRTGSVPLSFRHRMGKVSVKLLKGEGYEGDLPSDAAVYIHNTVTLAYVDLATGDVVKDSHERARSIRARKVADDRYEAIVVPQRLSNRVPLIEVVCGQVSYLFDSTVIFKSGMEHTITITLSDNPEKVAIEIGGQIENW